MAWARTSVFAKLMVLVMIAATWPCALVAAPPAAQPTDLDAIVSSLKSADKKQREAALKDLRKACTDGVSSAQAYRALWAAAGKFPTAGEDWWDPQQELVEVASSNPAPEFIAVIPGLMPKYSAAARSEALVLLSELKQRRAAEVWLEEAVRYGERGGLKWLGDSEFMKTPRFGDVLFPRLLVLTKVPELSQDVLLLCLKYLESNAVRPSDVQGGLDLILACYGTSKAKLMPLQRDVGVAWMWDEAYRESRGVAEVALDVLGYLDSPVVRNELVQALRFTDARLKLFAALSLLRLGVPVSPQQILAIARSPEVRNPLARGLERVGRQALFPREFNNQVAFAESDMVEWLTYPTELGQAPDDIKLLKVVSVDTKSADGWLDYYVFKFRTLEPHWAAKNGWVLGVSGPFIRRDSPTPTSQGGTFSTFEAEGAVSPEEYVKKLSDLLQESRRLQGADGGRP